MISTKWLADPNGGRSHLSHSFLRTYEYPIHGRLHERSTQPLTTVYDLGNGEEKANIIGIFN